MSLTTFANCNVAARWGIPHFGTPRPKRVRDCGVVRLQKKLYYSVRPRTFDLLVRISADSSKMDSTKIKNHHYHLIFLLPPDSGHISGTISPTEMAHLSIFVEFIKEYN